MFFFWRQRVLTAGAHPLYTFAYCTLNKRIMSHGMQLKGVKVNLIFSIVHSQWIFHRKYSATDYSWSLSKQSLSHVYTIVLHWLLARSFSHWELYLNNKPSHEYVSPPPHPTPPPNNPTPGGAETCEDSEGSRFGKIRAWTVLLFSLHLHHNKPLLTARKRII